MGDATAITLPSSGRLTDTDRLQLRRDMRIDFAKECDVHLSTFEAAVKLLSCEQGEHMQPLVKLIKIALTIPVSSCTLQRSFSTLHRIKTYLRSTMGQASLNHVSLLHCHKHLSWEIDLNAVANEFQASHFQH
ncbi:UNVERIFIED_CONTAM: hypothetical protein FKN15_056399 [Acipenser sinensis]